MVNKKALKYNRLGLKMLIKKIMKFKLFQARFIFKK